jgi:hypothetical protein
MNTVASSVTTARQYSVTDSVKSELVHDLDWIIYDDSRDACIISWNTSMVRSFSVGKGGINLHPVP